MRITIVPIDRTIIVDGEGLTEIEQDWSWISPDIHAIQWYDDHGEIEYIDNRPNERITELGNFFTAVQKLNSEKYRREQVRISEEAAKEAIRDYWSELRDIRNFMLKNTDWTQLPDAQITTEQKNEVLTFRQNLRDYPSTITDPKQSVNAFNNRNLSLWPSIPSFITTI